MSAERDATGRPARPSARALREGMRLLPNLIKLAWRLVRDERVPFRSRAFAAVALGYVALPYDLIPDKVPMIGRIDDLLVVALALHYLMRSAGDEVVREYWDGSVETLTLVGDVVEWAAGLVPWRLRKAARLLAGTEA